VLASGVEEARRWRLDVTTEVLRVREPVEGLAKYVEQQGVDLLILGARPDEARGLSHDLAAEIFRRSACETVLDYIAAD
jgi:nucleotide-binding universal stress UspA family protein